MSAPLVSLSNPDLALAGQLAWVNPVATNTGLAPGAGALAGVGGVGKLSRHNYTSNAGRVPTAASLLAAGASPGLGVTHASPVALAPYTGALLAAGGGPLQTFTEASPGPQVLLLTGAMPVVARQGAGPVALAPGAGAAGFGILLPRQTLSLPAPGTGALRMHMGP